MDWQDSRRRAPNDDREPLTREAAEAIVDATLSRTSGVRIGAEVEWLVFDVERPDRLVPAAETLGVAAGPPLPGGGTIGVEPGGQLELSTDPLPGPVRLAEVIEQDAGVLAERFARSGLVLVPLGLDPHRPPCPTLVHPRYQAMEHYFRRVSPAGVQMMGSTASLQVSVDQVGEGLQSWRVLGAVAPLLSAVFANSGEPRAGSARQRVWAATDPCRTSPVPTTGVGAWVDAVLDARVMLELDGATVVGARRRRSFRAWLDDRRHPPTRAELEVHLTTMFPPVRPRRHLEVRVIDAVPATGRQAAVGAVWALATDAHAGEEALRIAAEVPDPWDRALAAGLSDERLGEAAFALLDVVAHALDDEAPALSASCRAWAAGRREASSRSEAVLDLAEPL